MEHQSTTYYPPSAPRLHNYGDRDQERQGRRLSERMLVTAYLLQDQFGLALVRLENTVRGIICGAMRHKLIPTPQNLVTSTSLTTTYESFFGLHPLSQVLDQINPLTQIVHGRKWSYLGPGGLTGRTASFRIRDIHPSHYGRICPIDTSEGINVGLIGSLATQVRHLHVILTQALTKFVRIFHKLFY